MTPEDRWKFTDLVKTLTATTRHQWNIDRRRLTDAYFKALERYELDEIDRAVWDLIREPGRVFIPTPGELIARMDAERWEARLRAERAARDIPRVEPSDEERAAVDRLLRDLHRKLT